MARKAAAMPAPQLPCVLHAWMRTVRGGAAKMSPVCVCRVSFCSFETGIRGVSGLDCLVVEDSAFSVVAGAGSGVGCCWLAETWVEVVVGASVVSGVAGLEMLFGSLESAAAATEFCSATRCLKFNFDWTFGMVVLKFVVCARIFEVRWVSKSFDWG